MLQLRILCALAAAIGSAGTAQAACSVFPSPDAAAQRRTVTARDIIELREIGFADGALSGRSPLAVSPDGRQLAFVVTRADIETNTYCRALVIVELRPRATPAIVDTGGEFMPLGTFVRGLWVEVGLQKPVTPVWSPDGRSVAVLKREHGITQAIVVRVDGSRPEVITNADVDVEDVWWSGDGTKLFYSCSPSVKSAEHRIEREGQAGWLYDDRWAPNDGAAPRLQATDAVPITYSLDVASGSSQPATKSDARRPGASDRIVAATGAEAWLQHEEASPVSAEHLWLSRSAEKSGPCPAEACRGRFVGLWWAPDGKELWFLKREGWNHGTSALYRWRGDSSLPTRVLGTVDVLDNCVPARKQLVCTSENSTHPRTIVLVDPSSGERTQLFDPNPQFANIQLGTVQRLKWRNDRGFEAWGDLVLPPGYRRGTKLPLIIVQYNSRGFLRGGTGNEYPIYPLAAAGFAVLSFDRPAPVASMFPKLRTDVELNAANEKGWAERRSIQSALLRGIDLAVATGSVDPNRIGITGLSDGATSARFALLNSKRFAAAAISSCCLEPKTVMTYGGIRWAEFNRALGYPPATVNAPEFWRPVSLVVNADRFHTPLLIQQSDDEYLLGLEALEALREKDAPAELYVFPNEHHVKWQPRHKLAVLSRTLDWFDFWLRCREDPAPEKAGQYRRWEGMRRHATRTSALCPAITH
jgi:dipeptidyl aminopeptidase/acylaminoacyl peptidase